MRSKLLLPIILFFQLISITKAQIPTELYLPANIEEYDWRTDRWEKVSDKELTYSQDGKVKHYDKLIYNSDLSVTKEIVDYDTISRVTNLLLLIKPNGSSSFLNDTRGYNCFSDYFNSCGNSGEQWNASKGEWIYKYGRRNSVTLLMGNKVSEVLWENWDNNRQQWIKSERDELIYDNNQKLTEKITYTWDQVTLSWVTSIRIYMIVGVPGRPTLFSSYVRLNRVNDQWVNAEKYSMTLNGKTAFTDQTEKYENNSWVAVSKNEVKANEDFSYERLINNKWITIETSTKLPLFDHHQRYGLLSNGDTTEKHFHKRWYDNARNTLRYVDYTNTSGSINYYEEINDVTYGSDGFLDYYVQNSKYKETDNFEKKKKFVHRNYVNVVTGLDKESKEMDSYKFEVYPNPSDNGQFTIRSNNLVNTNYLIHSLQGELLVENEIENGMVNAKDLPDGVYVLTLGRSNVLISILK